MDGLAAGGRGAVSRHMGACCRGGVASGGDSELGRSAGLLSPLGLPSAPGSCVLTDPSRSAKGASKASPRSAVRSPRTPRQAPTTPAPPPLRLRSPPGAVRGGRPPVRASAASWRPLHCQPAAQAVLLAIDHCHSFACAIGCDRLHAVDQDRSLAVNHDGSHVTLEINRHLQRSRAPARPHGWWHSGLPSRLAVLPPTLVQLPGGT